MRHSGFNASHEAPAGLDDIPTRQKGGMVRRGGRGLAPQHSNLPGLEGRGGDFWEQTQPRSGSSFAILLMILCVLFVTYGLTAVEGRERGREETTGQNGCEKNLSSILFLAFFYSARKMGGIHLVLGIENGEKEREREERLCKVTFARVMGKTP
ncbi:hypothetical protein VDGL01_09797 [Verticillium dahliae]